MALQNWVLFWINIAELPTSLGIQIKDSPTQFKTIE